MTNPASIEDFGSDGYTYVRGDPQRYQTRRVRTILPCERETNAAFERRMELIAQQLTAMGVASISQEFERRAGSIVQCVLDVVYPPKAAPIAEDNRPAGGRPPSVPRGGR